jgi:hypothetical protein
LIEFQRCRSKSGEFPQIETTDNDLRVALEVVVSENLINTVNRRHFIPKKQWRKYNAVSMNGNSPNESNGD